MDMTTSESCLFVVVYGRFAVSLHTDVARFLFLSHVMSVEKTGGLEKKINKRNAAAAQFWEQHHFAT